jgi:hypothetical protein
MFAAICLESSEKYFDAISSYFIGLAENDRFLIKADSQHHPCEENLVSKKCWARGVTKIPDFRSQSWSLRLVPGANPTTAAFTTATTTAL